MIIPYDSDKIAGDTKYFSKDTVIVAMELFKKLNLIYTDLYLINLKKMNLKK